MCEFLNDGDDPGYLQFMLLRSLKRLSVRWLQPPWLWRAFCVIGVNLPALGTIFRRLTRQRNPLDLDLPVQRVLVEEPK